MREIEFRGKRIMDNKWIYGSLILENDGDCSIFHYDKPIFHYDKRGISGADGVKCKTIGQYTGLKDKNGEKIFEGDKLEYNCGVFVVSFCTEWGSYSLCNPDNILDTRDFNEIVLSYSEIIGNIHE